MKEMIWFERQDYCPNCKTQKALNLCDIFGNETDFPSLLDNEDYSIFEKSQNSKCFTHMKCKKCGKEFFINWSDGIPPKPLFSYFYKVFMENFKNTKLY